MSWNSDIFESSLEEPREELPLKKRKLCKDDGEEVRSELSKKPASKPVSNLCKAGLTIGRRIPAPSNDWALTIALSLTGKNFSACSNKCRRLETSERLGVKFIGARPVVNMLHDVNNTNINIYLVSTMPSTMLLTPLNTPLVSLKVSIQNERTRWFTDGTLRSAFVQDIVRVEYSPSLLLL